MIGAGYWGPNLARNFRASPEWELAAICDLDVGRALRVSDSIGGAPVTTDLREVLAAEALQVVGAFDLVQEGHESAQLVRPTMYPASPASASARTPPSRR